jgi:hypothetical protein
VPVEAEFAEEHHTGSIKVSTRQLDREFHPGPDLLFERAVVSHAVSLAATLPRALIAWLSGD